jgi:hypothetical protein
MYSIVKGLVRNIKGGLIMKITNVILMGLLMITVSVALTGCSDVNREGQIVENNPYTVCFNGVTYYTFVHGVAVALDKEGKIILCDSTPIIKE